jgi:hypothetical protein
VTALLLSLALLAPERIAALPAPEREAWQHYVETSRKQGEIDRAGLAQEVKAAGLEAPPPAPAGPPFALLMKMAPRTLADVLVSFQTPSGGWSKNLDLTRRREPGQSYSAEKGWRWVGTFDNDATVGPLRALADASRACDEPSHADAFRRGIEYVLLAQFPNGCWPQVYPLEGGYHDAATFNDDAIVGHRLDPGFQRCCVFHDLKNAAVNFEHGACDVACFRTSQKSHRSRNLVRPAEAPHRYPHLGRFSLRF